MGLESASFISGLVDTNPSGSDSISQGDDHLRLIKKVVQDSLPDVDQAAATVIVKGTAPTTQVKGTIWYDTTLGILKVNTATTGASPSWADLAGGAGTRAFSVTKGGTNQTGVVSGTWTKVTWPTEEYDVGGVFASDKFTCDVAGKYHFYFALKLTGNVLYDNAVGLYKDGVLYRFANYFIAYDSGANTGVPTMQMEAALDLTVGQYVEVFVHQESSSNQTVDGATTASWFTGHKIA
jgi:hypothetical protein